jgi:hypothetical protein
MPERHEWLVHVDGEMDEFQAEVILNDLFDAIDGRGDSRGVAVVMIHDDPLPYA